ncbi:MAG: alpha-hydroxy acid oxidase, partial [Comamonas sp.]
ADAICVSTHGGRQLDACISPLQALPDIKKAVPSDYPVLIDGGFRRGTDVLKALALGARMVFTGRPQLFGAAAAGRQGIEKAVSIFRSELYTNMALLGCANTQDVTADLLQPIGTTAVQGR